MFVLGRSVFKEKPEQRIGNVMQDEMDAVRERAYQIWIEEGQPEGREHEHWRQACKDVGVENEATDAPPPAEPESDDPAIGAVGDVGTR